MVWNKNIIHNKNKMEFKNYAFKYEQDEGTVGSSV